MKSLKKDLSFITLYYKHAKYGILAVILFMCVTQLVPMYTCLRNYPSFVTGYDYSKKIPESFIEFPLKEVEFVPSFYALLEYCNFRLFFINSMCFTLLGIVLISRRLKTGAKPGYTLHRLTISRKRAFYLQVIAAFLALLSVIVLENIIIVLSYSMYLQMIPERLHSYNGFFLNYLSSEIMVLVFPIFHFKTLLLLLLFLLSASVLCVNGAFYYRHKEHALVICCGLLVLLLLTWYLTSINCPSDFVLFYSILAFLIIGMHILMRSKQDYTYHPSRFKNHDIKGETE